MTFQPPPPPPPQGPPPQGPPPQGPPPQGPPPQQGPPPGGPSGQWGPPPGPPSGQWGPPPGPPARAGGSFDPKTVNQLDWGILGVGVLIFIFSFVSYYTVDYSSSFGSASGSESAWHGFFGWFAVLAALVGSGVVALELFQPHVKLPFPNRLVALVAYAVATLSVLLALVVFPESVPDIPGVDTGRGFGYWISLILI